MIFFLRLLTGFNFTTEKAAPNSLFREKKSVVKEEDTDNNKGRSFYSTLY